jgi:His/Glu/Gln/Arg/opine family amino acid ABC transporter permease subunit
MSIGIDATPLREAPPPVRGLRLSSRQQSLIGVAAILLLIPFALRMDPHNFLPFTDPSIWRFLAEGVVIVLLVSTVAIGLSLPIAVALALGRLSTTLALRAPSIAFVEGIRAIPLLLLIFYVFLNMPRDVSSFVGRETIALTLALMIYTAAINAETLRAGILALDRGQMEAARSLGLTHWNALRLVILPQAFRSTLPPLLAQFTTLVKDTSLGLAIGMVELLSRGRIIYQGERNPMETLYVVGLLYFAVNFILEQASLATQRGGSARQQ